MNILYINHYAGSYDLGMEYRPWMLSKEWQEQGHKIRIIASEFSHLRQVKIQFKDDFHIQKIDNCIEYQWVKTPTYRGNGVKRFINILWFVTKISLNFFKTTKNFKPDVVIASSTYPLDIFPAFLIAKIYNAKLIHEIHDLWPLTLKELGGFQSWHPMIILFQLAENFSCRFSDRVVSMLPGAWEYLKKHGLAFDRYLVVPNGVNIKKWDDIENIPDEMNAIITQKKEEGYFLIGYTGSIGISNAMNFFIQALNELKNEKIFAFIVGNGPEKEELMTRCEELEIANICFLNKISKKQIPDFLSKMDCLYIGWQKKSIYNYGTNPNKILDYMMAKKPIIHSVTASNDWVQEAEAGISVPAEDYLAIANAVKLLRKTPEINRKQIGERGRNFVEKNHAYFYLAVKFLEGL
jgi:glycosyltransferase involved in cell wall biosynthesis